MTTIVKGNKVAVAKEADDEGVLGGLDNFKVQIIQCEDDENAYRIRSVADKGSYLYGVNDKLSWSGNKKNAMRFTIAAGDPTSNESIADAAKASRLSQATVRSRSRCGWQDGFCNERSWQVYH